ncbi:MAG: hypothetical protein LUB59_02670 [Candidatus Gastranaerophilales bacterium]|nr:hypothetical protein [Candidatus Gastranaerophilales bacterium]
MYIFECLLKWFFPKKLGKEYDYDPLKQSPDENAGDECKHEFMPVDSTGETLACIKCGFIVKMKDNDVIKKD